jgi:hypothetical protein
LLVSGCTGRFPWARHGWPAVAGSAFHLATGGYGQAQEVIGARTGVTVGRAQLAGLAGDLAAWTDDVYSGRARDAEEEEQPDSDVIMMQADGQGIALRQRVFLVDGNKQQITAIEAQAAGRGLKVPVLIDYIHVSGYLGKAAAGLHPAVVVNGDLDDYMRYYKERYRDERHLARYDSATIDHLGLTA